MTKRTGSGKVSEAALQYVVEGAEEHGAMTTTLSSKNQVTLPVALVRALGLSPGDQLSVRRTGDALLLRRLPRLRELMGVARGIYGGSPEEMEEYLREIREEWEERERRISEPVSGEPTG